MAGAVHGVLAGYDGSPRSEEALIWAASEALLRSEVLTVCQAWAPGFPTLTGDAAVVDAAKHYAQRSLACGVLMAQTFMGTEKVRPLLIAGPAAAVLCEQSASATMVVVGSRGHGSLAGLLLGSVSSQVASHGHGPVVVVREGSRRVPGKTPRPIVVGTDGCAGAEAAVEFAFAEAALSDTTLRAVCALAGRPGGQGDASRVREDFEHQIDRWEKEYPEVAVRRRVTYGSARATLLEAAREAQMLVVGSRGRGGLHGMKLGSVSQALAHHTPCPVSVVHPRDEVPPRLDGGWLFLPVA